MKIEELVNRLFEDLIFVFFMEILNEGDLKVVVYVFFLYVRYEFGLENEVKEIFSIVMNKLVKVFFEILLRKGYNF